MASLWHYSFIHGMGFFLFIVFSFLAGACWSSTLKIGRVMVHSFMPVQVWRYLPQVFFIIAGSHIYDSNYQCCYDGGVGDCAEVVDGGRAS